MGLISLKKDQILHHKEDLVQTIEIVIKGSLVASLGEGEVTLPSGSMIGIFERPGENYSLTYRGKDECQVYSYDYGEADDIRKVIEANSKLTQMLLTKVLRSAKDLYDLCGEEIGYAQKDYDTLQEQLDEYPILCREIGEQAEIFSGVFRVLNPPEEVEVDDWQLAFLEGLIAHESSLSQTTYGIDPDISTGIVLMASKFASQVLRQLEEIQRYRQDFKEKTGEFRQRMILTLAKANSLSKEQGLEEGEVPEITGALETILAYAGLGVHKTEEFKGMIKEYKNHPDRQGTSDDVRQLCRKMTAAFYEVYYAAFLNSMMDEKNLPMEIRMFFYFGFVDEELAGERNTKLLYLLARNYKPDQQGKVLTMYEWLQKIYLGQAEPSKNEFDNDYEAQLKEDRNNGLMTQEAYEDLLGDTQSKTYFELKNMCASANRMTFGKVAGFSPVFDSQNVLKPIDKIYLTAKEIHQKLDEITAIDYSLFYRTRTFSKPECEITHFEISKEIRPYVILMPNIGSRICLWQEIEGRDRGTPSRMVMPILMAEDVNKNLVQACGEFRWEMCKTLQGVRWSDIRDLSLTSEYNDYIQCYRKNTSLSPEQRERIKKTLKKVGNNLRRTFVEDYVKYILIESKGSQGLNKVSRGILFKYCPFTSEIRSEIGSNPAYSDFVALYENQIKQRKHTVEILQKKLVSKGLEVPQEILEEVEYLEK